MKIRTWNLKKLYALHVAKKKALLEARSELFGHPATAEILKKHFHYLEQDQKHVLAGHYNLKQLRADYAHQKKDFGEAWEMFRKSLTAPGFAQGFVRAVERDLAHAHEEQATEQAGAQPAPALPEPSPA